MNNKNIIIIAIVAVAIAILGIVLYFIWRGRTSREGDQANNEVHKSNLSYPKSSYSGWAESLYQLLDGGFTGTTQAKMILKNMKTPDDYLQLKASFGSRDVHDWFGGLSEKAKGLSYFITRSFSTSDIREMQTYFTPKGITL